MRHKTFATTIAAAVLAAATLFALPAYADGQPAELAVGYPMAWSAWADGSASDKEALYEQEMAPKPLTPYFATRYTGCDHMAAAYRIGIATHEEALYERGTRPKPPTRGFATGYSDCDRVTAAYRIGIDRHGGALARTTGAQRHAHASTAPLSPERTSVRYAERTNQPMSERRDAGSERRVHREGDHEPAGGYGITS